MYKLRGVGKRRILKVLKQHIRLLNVKCLEDLDPGQHVVNFPPSHQDYKWIEYSEKNATKQLQDTEIKMEPNCEMEDTKSIRYNTFGIQMISKNLFEQLFHGKSKKLDEEKIKSFLSTLKKYGLLETQKSVPNVNLEIPKLLGKDLEEHFYNIAEQQCRDYRNLLKVLLVQLPDTPNEWLLQAGWTRYTKEGSKRVDYPLEDSFLFDVEVCCKEGELPTLATAASEKAWYVWVSEDLINGSRKIGRNNYSVDHLIPLESGKKTRSYNISSSLRKPRVVVGHNISYDRARVKEQYWLEKTGLRFVDTLALHVCVSGVTSYQKALLKAGLSQEEWSKFSSLNSLSKVHELYCGSEISKIDQDIFINGTLEDIQKNFQTATTYCSSDVKATHAVLRMLLPMFLNRFPHPVTLAGMLELQSAFIPVNGNWNKYLAESHQAFDDLDMEAKSLLSHSADEACHLMHDDKFKTDLWLWDQDWSVKHIKLKKHCQGLSKNISNLELNESQLENIDMSDEIYEKLKSRFDSLMRKDHFLPLKGTHLPGYPSWYKKLCPRSSNAEWVPGPELIGTGMQIAPKLLQLTWKGMPLHYIKGHGWGYIVPYKTNIAVEHKSRIPVEELIKYCKDNKMLCSCKANLDIAELQLHEMVQTNLIKYLECKKKKDKNYIKNLYCKSEISDSCGLIKLPHKDGGHLNVGNPLARDFINQFSGNGLSGSQMYAHRIIEISRMLSYWRNNRERIEKQLVCWLNKKDTSKQFNSNLKFGAILPQIVVCGTLTRRAVERTWMTASNAIGERVGSELRGIIQSPPGYSFVGADVDSQELWIASLLGDAFLAGLHGVTPFGWMTLNGQKSEGTDLHSVTAKAVGISRNHAKILNYARIYGAGQKFAERLLKQFNPDMTVNEAQQKAATMFKMTKGSKLYHLKDGILPDVEQRDFSKQGAKEMCTFYNKSVEELFCPPQWVGGTESAMFNCLEEIAQMSSPETPFLKSKLSRALEPIIDQNDRHLPTRINWVVQSGAVDFLHLMLVSMRWFLGPRTRFCLSFHDEVRYLVPNEYKYEAALALHVTNLLTRAFCVIRLGMSDLPQSVAFFSSVEIDTVLRKESNDENKTPSNPYGLSKGYDVPIGESLDIYAAIEKAKGVTGVPKIKQKKC